MSAVLAGYLDVFLRPMADAGLLRLGQGADHFRGRSHDEGAGWHDLAFGQQRAGTNDGAGADFSGSPRL